MLENQDVGGEQPGQRAIYQGLKEQELVDEPSIAANACICAPQIIDQILYPLVLYILSSLPLCIRAQRLGRQGLCRFALFILFLPSRLFRTLREGVYIRLKAR